jgi:hypothetical protein
MEDNLLILPTYASSDGNLTVLEKLLPFSIKRVFWIYAADFKIRGGHRHKKTTQALVAIKGQVDIYVNDGNREQVFPLTKPDQCLIINPQDWHTMHFMENSILLVFASTEYDQNDYVDEPYQK